MVPSLALKQVCVFIIGFNKLEKFSLKLISRYESSCQNTWTIMIWSIYSIIYTAYKFCNMDQ